MNDRKKPSIEELERILAMPAEALKIEIQPNGEIRARTKEEWVPIALRMTADDWEKLPAVTRREVHDLAADIIAALRRSQPEGVPRDPTEFTAEENERFSLHAAHELLPEGYAIVRKP